MGSQMKHAPGNFCWFELGTSDQTAAKEFYDGLFGWGSKIRLCRLRWAASIRR